MSELSLANVAAEVTAWRKTKQHRTSILPKEIADHIRELAKSHKTHHIAKVLKMSATTVNKVLQIDQGFRAAYYGQFEHPFQSESERLFHFYPNTDFSFNRTV